MSVELPVATRHRRDMTEKLLKVTLKNVTIYLDRFKGVNYNDNIISLT